MRSFCSTYRNLTVRYKKRCIVIFHKYTFSTIENLPPKNVGLEWFGMIKILIFIFKPIKKGQD